MSHRSSIGCVQKDFRTYGTFGENHAPILHQDYHCLQTNRNQLPLEHRHLGVPSGASKMISEPMVRSVQTMDLACFKITTISKWTEMSFHFEHCHLVVPSGVSKMISEPMDLLAQPCTYLALTLTLSPTGTEMSFHLSLVT
jgi:hypothetical protein